MYKFKSIKFYPARLDSSQSRLVKALTGAIILFAAMLALPGFANAGITNISSCGNLSVANETFVLQNDVVSNNGCFSILANNITLDLNGRTVTYDNEAPVSIPNNSFENPDMSAWDLTAAVNTERASGTFVAPVSVYDGDYALRTTTPTADQTITSSSAITLQPNTAYSLSAMIYNQVNDSIAITLSMAGAGTVSGTGKTYRGFQWITTNFTTGASPVAAPITLSITGASSVGAGFVYIDDVRIQKWRQHGISVGPNDYAPYNFPGLSQYGTSTGVTIKNGTITQGQGKGERSHAIAVGEQSSLNLTVDNVVFNVSGPSSRAYDSYNNNYSIFKNNTINSTVSTIKSRDNYDGALIYGGSGAWGQGSEVFGNTITGGIQTGIVFPTKTNASLQNKIYDNNITLQSRYSNDFAIFSEGSEIYANTISCGSGNNSCRGIWAGGTGTIVRNNVIDVQELARNQEYNGCALSGAYGIQSETSINTQVYGNVVNAYAGACDATAYRANPFEDGNTSVNNEVYGNTFSAIAGAAGRASSLRLSGATNEVLSIHNNTLKTNRRWIYVDGVDIAGFNMLGNRWETTGTLDNPFYPFEVYTYGGVHFSGTFYDNSYGAGDQSRFETAVFRYGGSNDPLSSFSVVASDVTAPSAPTGLGVM